jgi:LexA-binding, inner membrane-associated putative hydrolase
MNLTTHWAVALALGIAIFHNVEIALVMSIGALIPDLDREYLFVARDFIARHQLHRSLFHNFFFIAILYFINPFLSLGALTHSLLDMFTSATDRGAELLYPLTRLVGKYYYTIEGEKPDPKKKTASWVEDPWRLLKSTSDRDLQEPTEQPWRRSYGPFKNSRVVDWGIFFSSLIFLPVSYFGSSASLYSTSGFSWYSLIPLVGIGIFYGLGEWWRRRLIATHPEETNWKVLIILLVGLVVFFLGGYYFLYAPPAIPDLTIYGYGAISVVIGFVISYAFVKARKKYEDLSL